MKNIILIVWAMWSWKDTVANYISKKYNIPAFWISTSLKLLAKEKWLPQDRDTLISLWAEVAKDFWDSFLAQKIIELTKEDTFIIFGTRQIGQLEYLFQNTNCFSIGILSDKQLRYKRITSRFWEWEYSYDLFLKQEYRDNFEWPQKVDLCVQMCENIIKNNTTLEDLYKNIDNTLEKNNFL